MAFIKDGLFAYFRRIDITQNFNEFITIIFNDPTISNAGARADRLSVDILPLHIKDLFNEYNDSSKEMKRYFGEVLYPLVCAHNHFVFIEFYDFMIKGIQPYTTNEGRKALYEEVKKRKGSMPALENNKKPALEIYSIIQNRIKTTSIRQCSKEEFVNILYLIFYYLCYGFIPDSIDHKISGLSYDIKEYEDMTNGGFGHYSRNGLFMLRYLVERENPNSIALLETGNLNYNGINGFLSDKARAYQYYKMAVESKNYNPRAGWALGYMQYYYKTHELKDTVIPELDVLSVVQRKEIAFFNILLAYSSGYTLAALTLANMCEDPDMPAKFKDIVKTKEAYLLEAASFDNPFGYYYLFKYYDELSQKAKEKESKQSYLDKAMEALHKAIKFKEPSSLTAYAKILMKEGKVDEATDYLFDAVVVAHEEAAYLLLKHYLLNKEYNANQYYAKHGILNPNEYTSQLLRICDNSEKYKDLVKNIQKS